MRGRFDDEREKHLGQTEYVGCPHCECPVNVSEALQRSLAWFASALLSHVRKGTPLYKALDRIALFAGDEAWTLAEDASFELSLLRDLHKRKR